jgi:hypothetical protein
MTTLTLDRPRAVDLETGEILDAPAPSLTPPSKLQCRDVDFLADDRLERLAAILIDRHHLIAGMVNLAVRWKATGGKYHGKTVALSGLNHHLHGVDFAIWLAADHLREREYSPRQIEALLYHQLLRIGADDDGKPVLLDPDIIGFRDELIEYGAWHDDLAKAKASFEQARLL